MGQSQKYWIDGLSYGGLTGDGTQTFWKDGKADPDLFGFGFSPPFDYIYYDKFPYREVDNWIRQRSFYRSFSADQHFILPPPGAPHFDYAYYDYYPYRQIRENALAEQRLRISGSFQPPKIITFPIESIFLDTYPYQAVEWRQRQQSFERNYIGFINIYGTDIGQSLPPLDWLYSITSQWGGEPRTSAIVRSYQYRNKIDNGGGHGGGHGGGGGGGGGGGEPGRGQEEHFARVYRQHYWDNYRYDAIKSLFMRLAVERDWVTPVFADWVTPPPVPSFDYAFYDANPYREVALKQLESWFNQSLVFNEITGAYVIPGVPAADGWLPVLTSRAIAFDDRTGQVFLAFPNDISEGVIISSWDPGPTVQADARRLLSDLRWRDSFAASTQSSSVLPVTLLVVFRPTMAVFSARLIKTSDLHLLAMMNPFLPNLNVVTPRPPTVPGGYIISLCVEDRNSRIIPEPNPEMCYQNRGIIAMPSAIITCKMFDKDPSAKKDYFVDWSELLETSEYILTSSWDGGGLTIDKNWFTGGVAYAYVYGGTLGTVYVVGNTITTSKGRTYKREILINVVAT
jgi:hypothetical protein